MKKPSPFTLILMVVFLIAGYIAFQLIADVSATKIVQVGSFALPAGTFVYAITFTWRDLIHKRLGKDWARAAILSAAVMNLFMVLYFQFAINLPAAAFWGGQAAFVSTLGIVWRIAIASIVAELISELVDTELYSRLEHRFTGRLQFVRVLGSNTVSLPLDSVVFAFLAFYGSMPVTAILSIIGGQIIYKGVVTLVSLPLIYLIKDQSIAGMFFPSGLVQETARKFQTASEHVSSLNVSVLGDDYWEQMNRIPEPERTRLITGTFDPKGDPDSTGYTIDQFNEGMDQSIKRFQDEILTDYRTLGTPADREKKFK